MGTLGNREVKRNNDGSARATSIKKWYRKLNSDHGSNEKSPNKWFNELIIKNYNFLDCDWFKKLLFSTNSLVNPITF